MTSAVNKRTKDYTWFSSVALAGSILLKQKNEKMDATASVVGVLLKSKSVEVCGCFAKGMKQTRTTVLLGFLVLVSFCMGHNNIVVDQFWEEPIIIWITTAIATGRCKSAFHQFLKGIMEDVERSLEERNSPQKEMILTNCTWEKFGERLASAGGRQLGLFDEMVSFFSTMNMYSSAKMQVSDTKEYQDFLEMFTGKSKTRETVTGNANFRMSSNSFTMFGFTQPFAALPIIKDIQNNAKGFTSRILWYFPKPIFCTIAERRLDIHEKEMVSTFRKHLVFFLADLYECGESTYSMSDKSKMKMVKVERRQFSISESGQELFDNVHDKWECICEDFPYDPLLGGLYSRGKAQVLRLSVPIEILLRMMDSYENQNHESLTNIERSSNDNSFGVDDDDDDDDDDDRDRNENGEGGNDDGSIVINHSVERNGNEEGDNIEMNDIYNVDDDEEDMTNPVLKALPLNISNTVGKQAIEIAVSIVEASIKQLCTLNEKNVEDSNKGLLNNGCAPTMSPLSSIIKSVIMTKSAVVSFSILTIKGRFKANINGETGKALCRTVAMAMKDIGVGEMKVIQIAGNKSEVYFYLKRKPPQETGEEAIQMSQKLAALGISFTAYCSSFCTEGEEFERHNGDYERKKNGVVTPNKRLRLE